MTTEQNPNRFPIVLEMKLYITNGESTAVATFRCPAFKAVSDEYIANEIVKLSKDFPPGFRLMAREEVYNFLLTKGSATEGYAVPQLKPGEVWFSEATGKVLN